MKARIIAATVACFALGGMACGAFAETAGQKVDDATIVAKVKSKLLASKDVSGMAVDVDAKDGVVTLSGTADTKAERSKAAQIAKSTGGVARVDNHIVVKSAAGTSSSTDTTGTADKPGSAATSSSH